MNARGELIGINTAIYSGSGGNLGIGFAIPVNMARGIMEQILKTGKVSRGYLGISIQNVTPELAKAFKLSSTNGVLIGDVSADSPGAKAGMQKGDVVVAINGQSVADAKTYGCAFHRWLRAPPSRLDILRDAQKRQLSATLMELPETVERASGGRNNAPEPAETGLEGLQVSALTADIAQQLESAGGRARRGGDQRGPRQQGGRGRTAARRRHSGGQPPDGHFRRAVPRRGSRRRQSTHPLAGQ